MTLGVEIGVDMTPEGAHVIAMYVLPDSTRCVFYSQFHPQQRTWVGLNWDDLPEIYVGDIAFLHGAKWAEAKLKEKNT
jgi:hypothetical protein